MARRKMSSSELQIYSELMSAKVAIDSAVSELDGFLNVFKLLSRGYMDDNLDMYTTIMEQHSVRLTEAARTVCSSVSDVAVSAAFAIEAVEEMLRTPPPTDDELNRY